MYSYFKAFKNNLHPNTEIKVLIKLAEDNNIIFRKGAVGACKVILTKFRLWCPKIIFNGLGMTKYSEDYLKPRQWTYLREYMVYKTFQDSSAYYQISSGIRRPRHVLIWVVYNASYNSQEHNIFTFNTFAIANNRHITRAQLMIDNSVYYPQLELSNDEKGR